MTFDSLSQRYPLFCRVIFYVCGRFSPPCFYLFSGEHFTSLGDKDDNTGGNQPSQPPPAKPSGPKITEITDANDASTPPQPDQPALPVDPHVQKILSDPANQQILMDPKIQQLIQHLRNDPEKAQK